jgi:hypothetical protein
LPDVVRPLERLRRERLRFRDAVRARRIPSRIEHLAGPPMPEPRRTDLLVISIVRNGERYLPTWFRHYERLGVGHFVILDNGSTDATIELLRARDDVTLLQTTLPYSTHENLLKRHLVERYATERWNLFVDVDELWDYPGSAHRSIAELLAYLDATGATGVIAQMLDFVADAPLSTLPSTGWLDEVSPYFDLSGIVKRPYEFSGGSPAGVPFHRGGIRASVFGTDNGLTKVPLVFANEQVRTFVQWHHVEGARLADFSTVLRHYPFSVDFARKVEEAARSGRYGAVTSDEYRAYWAVMEQDPDLCLRLPTAHRYEGVDQLVDLDFLQVSPRYAAWAGR